MRIVATVNGEVHSVDEVWEGEVDLRSNSIDVHISRLRARLEGSASVKVATLRGVGYRLETAG